MPPFHLAVLPHVMLPTRAQAHKTPHARTIAAQARADRRGRRRRAEARRRCRAARAARADSEDRPPAQPSRRMQLQRTRFNKQLSTYPVRPAVALNARAFARVRRQARACLHACASVHTNSQGRHARTAASVRGSYRMPYCDAIRWVRRRGAPLRSNGAIAQRPHRRWPRPRVGHAR